MATPKFYLAAVGKNREWPGDEASLSSAYSNTSNLNWTHPVTCWIEWKLWLCQKRIMCLTPSTWKWWSSKRNRDDAVPSCGSESEVKRSGVDVQVVLLSRLSSLSCFCWALNCLLYFWTCSGVVFYPPTRSSTSTSRQTNVSKRYVSWSKMDRPLTPAAPAWFKGSKVQRFNGSKVIIALTQRVWQAHK